MQTTTENTTREYLLIARAEASEYLGYELTDAEWAEAYPKAAQKLAWILNHDGDLDGERLKPYYLGKLVQEAVSMKAFQQYLDRRNAEIREAQKKKTASEERGHHPPTVYQNPQKDVNTERRSDRANTYASA